jgi:hypothetical protein
MCKDSFFGDEGDSNTACSSTVSSSLKKRCPNDCSNNGVCYYLSKATNNYISSCNTTDPTCYAECQCTAGFTSAACEMTIVQQQASSDYRSAMIGQIATISKLSSNPTSNTVNGWVNNLVELGKTSSYLTL